MTGKLGAERKCLSCSKVKLHRGRGLCTACHQRHTAAFTLHRFPLLQERVSPRERYEAWVASGLRPRDYARQVGILETSLARSLRIERERRDRLGLPWLTGWRKVRGGSYGADHRETEGHHSDAGGG